MTARRSRRSVAKGSVLLLSSALTVGAVGCEPDPEPQVDVSCADVWLNDGTPAIDFFFDVRDFPADETFRYFGLFDPENGYPTRGTKGGTVAVGPDGTGTTKFATSRFDPNAEVFLAVYRDLDGDLMWDPDGDDTVYRGDGTIHSCDSPVTLNPK